MEKENIRFYIFMRFKLGKDAKSIHEDFVSVFAETAPAYSTVARWVKLFKDGKNNFEDEPRAERPITGKSEKNIESEESIERF